MRLFSCTETGVLSCLFLITANYISKHFSGINKIDMKPGIVTIEDRYHLAHPRDLIWEKLNDPEILAACIRGCVKVERNADKQFKAVIRAHVGELKKDFNIVLDVEDDQAPAAYCLSSDVSAGILGKVKGKADVSLSRVDDDNTDLHYVATLSGSGVLGRALPLIEPLAAQRVRDFFDQFVAHL